MMFQFESVSAFFTMAGHGPFVWAAYGISIGLMLSLIVVPLQRKKKLMAQLTRDLRREQAQSQSQGVVENKV
jgi:heme exporter protein D